MAPSSPTALETPPTGSTAVQASLGLRGGAAEPPAAPATAGGDRVILCGHPNVGKSLLFNCLTGRYATVSNYPGTTVEISTGTSAALPGLRISDSPGAYSLLPISDEERVTRNLLLNAHDELIVHVADAKSLRRMLPMTLELLELRLRCILVLNLMDEADAFNVRIDERELSRLLGIPVVKTVATRNQGIDALVAAVQAGMPTPAPAPAIQYPPEIGQLAAEAGMDPQHPNVTLLLASGAAAHCAPEELGQLELAIRRARQDCADKILAQCASFPAVAEGTVARLFDRLTLNLWTAIPLALAVVYFGVYQFVGMFGAGTLVGWIEEDLYESHITPWLTKLVEGAIPSVALQDLLVHDYGVLTLGLRYAIALILPIVGTFFLLFSVMEDTGYLPRLALLLDRLFKKIGLNGRAVIPIVLGFGCGTMATMVTRVLETRRERVITTLLLGVAVPCSAQLGVILGMLGQRPAALVAWGGVMFALFLLLGTIAARLLPGEIPSFYLELPPLRLPRWRNVLTKTYSRMHWYFLEILPLFLLASVVIWAGKLTGAFDVVIRWLKPIVHSMGLPDAAASALLFGFFRRDYGAAGLFDMQQANQLDTRQVFVSVLVISLLLPCVAQFFVMKKERGWAFAIGASVGIVMTAFAIGIAANRVLVATGWMS